METALVDLAVQWNLTLQWIPAQSILSRYRATSTVTALVCNFPRRCHAWSYCTTLLCGMASMSASWWQEGISGDPQGLIQLLRRSSLVVSFKREMWSWFLNHFVSYAYIRGFLTSANGGHDSHPHRDLNSTTDLRSFSVSLTLAAYHGFLRTCVIHHKVISNYLKLYIFF